jgi:guanylate kinase
MKKLKYVDDVDYEVYEIIRKHFVERKSIFSISIEMGLLSENIENILKIFLMFDVDYYVSNNKIAKKLSSIKKDLERERLEANKLKGVN